MRLLYVCMYQFHIDHDGVYSLPAFGDEFWKKYLEVFDEVHIIGEPLKGYLNKGKLTKITLDNIHIDLLPSNNSPQDWKNDKLIRRTLMCEIKDAEALIIKPASRKGVMAIKIANRYKKPYMIEITGDLYTALKHHSNPLKRLYAPIINKQILAAIKNCKFGVYVTEHYLQEVYPIEGETCGASDAVIKSIENDVFARRLSRVAQYNKDNTINIGLVGFYHDANKGIDTAIMALSFMIQKNVCLYILGNGSEKDRNYWYDYARLNNINVEKVKFPEPIIGIDNMFAWYDSMDIVILPSRSEGLPRTIVEAMSRACPCITSNVCGLSELIQSEWTHEAGDYKKLANLLDYMITNKEQMKFAATYNFQKSTYFLESVQLKKRVDFMKKFRDYCKELDIK